jgi:hypothetical protein
MKTLDLQLQLAATLWTDLTEIALAQLKTLICDHNFSVASGDINYIQKRWYVTHSGLIRLARRRRCSGITVRPLDKFCDSSSSHWAFQATVFKTRAGKGFTGIGDADPSNISPLLRGSEMRIAETRAVSRALRKAYGIGICSVEEIGSFSGTAKNRHEIQQIPTQHATGSCSSGNGSGNGSRVRDRLCQLIRQHTLDAELVKSYAVDFCGTKTLRDATREQVEAFVVHLADWAKKDRNALLCQLNSYTRSQAGAA